MDYKTYLHTFLTVYRSGSQTAAAKHLHLTQPAVSQHIAILENKLGKQLFFRQSKKLQPTLMAKYLAEKIDSSMLHIDSAWEQLTAGEKQLTGVVFVGCAAELATTKLIPHCQEIMKNNIQLSFMLNHQQIVQKLLNEEIDLGILFGRVDHAQINVQRLMEEEFIFIGHSKWKPKINMSALHKGNVDSLHTLPWISYNEEKHFIKEFFHTCFNQPFQGKTNIVIEDLWAMLQAVQSGLGVTVMPDYVCEEALGKKRIVKLYTPKNLATNTLYLAWKESAIKNKKVALVRSWIRSIF